MEFDKLELPNADDLTSDDEVDEDIRNALLIHGGVGSNIPESDNETDRLIDILDAVEGQDFYTMRDEMGEILGVAGVEPDYSHDEFPIHGIVVHPEYPGSGLGIELMHFLERLASNKNKTYIGLIALRQSMNFYERLGYIEQKQAHAALMHKHLS